MTNYIYARYNKDSELFDPPFIAANDKHACMTFCYLYNALNDKFLDHFQLVRVGVFNNETGGVIGQDPVVVDVPSFIETEVKPTLIEQLREQLRKELTANVETQV